MRLIPPASRPFRQLDYEASIDLISPFTITFIDIIFRAYHGYVNMAQTGK